VGDEIEEGERGRACSTYGRDETHTLLWRKHLNVGDILHVGVVGRIILKY
jgi:hypothetical protein